MVQKSKQPTLLLALTLFTAPGIAFGEELMVWKSHPEIPPLILSAPNAASFRSRISSYQRAINQSLELAPLLTSPLELPTLEVSALAPTTSSGKPRILILTNRFDSIQDPKARAVAAAKKIQIAGADVYFLPMVADLGLSPEDSVKMRREVSKNFDAVLALGGDDVSPALYNQKTTYAKRVIPLRDQSELQFLQTYSQEGKGAIFGICRGHQLCAISHGHELIQDISEETQPSIEHQSGWHGIQIERDSFLYRILGKDQLDITTLHHQAVLPKPDGPLRVTAKSLEQSPITEALEFKNGRGLTFQFHPELMPNEDGRKILKGIVSFTRLLRRRNQTVNPCSELFHLP